MEEKKLKFYSLTNLPSVQASNSGSSVYDYKYLDIDPDTKAQVVKDGKKNVFEEIQSNLHKVDYKSKIKEGETFEDDGSGLYLDMSKFEPGLGSVDDYVNGVINSIREKLKQKTQNDDRSNTEGQKEATPVEKSTEIGSGTEGGDVK